MDAALTQPAEGGSLRARWWLCVLCAAAMACTGAPPPADSAASDAPADSAESAPQATETSAATIPEAPETSADDASEADEGPRPLRVVAFGDLYGDGRVDPGPLAGVTVVAVPLDVDSDEYRYGSDRFNVEAVFVDAGTGERVPNMWRACRIAE